MEKSTKIGIGIFAVILLVGFFLMPKGTGNVIAVGGNNDIIEVKTILQGFNYNPDTITVKKGSTVKLIIDNKDNVNHGLHLPQFGILDSIPPNSIKNVQFKAIETSTNGQAVPTCAQEHGETLTINVI